MRAILYFIVFLSVYFAIGFMVRNMGWSLPGTIYLDTPQGIIGFQIVQIITANVIAGVLMARLSG